MLCSADANSFIDSISVLNDVIVSDHRPVSFSLSCSLLHCPVSDGTNVSVNVPAWKNGPGLETLRRTIEAGDCVGVVRSVAAVH